MKLEELKNKIVCMDCMELMALMPDKYIDLAIVDPPYGIGDKLHFGGGSHTKNRSKFGNMYSESGKKWDIRPDENYFKELFRVSKNQIICGANYFVENLPVSRGWIFWDKQGEGMSSVNNELIFTSFDISIKTFSRCHGLDKGFMNKEGTNIHPTQKPIALGRWLLQKYAKPGDIILDTHSGSGTFACSAWLENFEFYACEKDPDYHKESVNRFETLISQGRLF